MERLEDRCVPSTLTVTSADDDVNEKHTLRWAVANAVNGDTILLASSLEDTPIVLTHGELVLKQDVIIRTKGNTPDTISGGGMSRVFEIAGGASVAFRNLMIIDGNGLANNPDGTAARDGSGGGVLNLGTLAVSDCSISGNTVLTQNGGGLLNYYGTLFVTDSTFSGNYAAGGGGLANDSGTATVRHSTFNGNSANNGGGINNGGAMTVSDCRFINNSAVQNGGGSGFGGGLKNGGGLTMVKCVLIGNTAFGGGGGLGNAAGDITVNDCRLANNSAPVGGGIYSNVGTVTVSSCKLQYNSASSHGGGMYGTDATMTVSDSTLICNSASGDGGGINSNGGTLSLSESKLRDNSAGEFGGGVYIFGGATLNDDTLSNNSANEGGGIYNLGTVTVNDGTIRDNVASGAGGGIANVGLATVSDCTLDGNSAQPARTASVIYSNFGPGQSYQPGDYSVSGEGGVVLPPNGFGSALGLSFTPTANFLFTSVELPLNWGPESGGPNSFIVSLMTDAGDHPGSALESFPSSWPVRTSALMTFVSTTNTPLDAGTTYWIVAMPNAQTAGGWNINSTGATGYSHTTPTAWAPLAGDSPAMEVDGIPMTYGGGISNSGTMTVRDSSLSGNSATGNGGGIFNIGALTVTDCLLDCNSAGANGGGIYNSGGGTAAVSECVVANNSAGGNGGGIFNSGAGGAVTVSDSTFFGNTPDNIFGLFTDLGGNTFG